MTSRERALVLSAGFAAGFAGMTLELAAVRLLAPYFGTSAYVWTNVIAVTLLALAVGAWLGGRIADRGRADRALLVALISGGGLCFLAPLLAPLLAQSLLPDELRLDEAFALLVSGSLLATLAVFGPPLALVGASSPLLVRRLVDGGSPVGRGSGGVYAFSTLGSLLGTFGTTHWFVPYLGSRGTVFLAGFALFAGALCLLVSRRGSRRVLAMLGLIFCGAGISFAVESTARAAIVRRLPNGWELVSEERESPYQSVRIIEQRTEERAWRWLQVNDGLDSFQSLRLEGEIFSDTYYDQLAVAALLARGAEHAPRVLVLGLGGGTLVPLLRELFLALGARLELVGVEIDPLVVELAELHLGLDPASVEILRDLDARVALRALRGPWDAILVDAYAGQVHIPAHLCSREFFEEARARLAPGGVLALNVGALGPFDRVAEAVSNTLAAAMGQVATWPVPRNRNAIVFAVNGGIDTPAWASRLERAERVMPERAGPSARPRLADMRAAIAVLGAACSSEFDTGGIVLTDDDTRIDLLQMEALRRSVEAR